MEMIFAIEKLQQECLMMNFLLIKRNYMIMKNIRLIYMMI